MGFSNWVAFIFKNLATFSVANSQRSASEDVFRWLTVANQVARWTLAGKVYTLTAKLSARWS